ncbi:MAG: ornithine cyclodeaminase family protein [Nitrososphaerota archaeon]|nr:ornithine cyclodeaminase family protein [Nitrososphaerota archaeon]
MVLLLSDEDVRSSMDMAGAMAAVRESFELLGKGRVQMPLRVSVAYPNTAGVVRLMGASIDGMGALGSKLLLGQASKRAPGLTYFVVSLFDPADGHLLAIMGANRLTQLRTGAASAVAAGYLCRKDAETVGLFGAGVQAMGQLEGLASVLEIKKVRVFSRDRGRRDDFCRSGGRLLGIDVQGVEQADSAVRGCDAVVTSTTSSEPLFSGDAVEPGTHISAVGSNNPARRELDVATIRRAKVVVDHMQQALDESGDFAIPMKQGLIRREDIHAELSELVLGTKDGRVDDSEVTLFKSVGIASEDVAVGRAVYDRAVKLGLGREVTV